MYQVDYYNLDVIIYVGYCVKTFEAHYLEFRQAIFERNI